MSVAPLTERLAARIARHGPMPVSEYVDAALYDEVDGFYAGAGRAGRRGDFLTAPEVGPLFGAVLARALDAWWDGAGCPDRWTITEHGAGPGTLLRSVLAAGPRCLGAGALRWVAVERSEPQRREHPVHPAVESPPPPPPGAPITVEPDVVFANELLDNLPFDIVERTAGGWAEVRVTYDEGEFRTATGDPTDVAPPGTGIAVGVWLPVQLAAHRWLQEAVTSAGTRVVVLDYGATTRELADRRGGWLRTYRGHGEAASWLEDPGSCDITADVDLEHLQVGRPASIVDNQAGFLRRHGIDELVDEGRAAWRAGAAVGDLAALRARSRVREAEALLDPTGMGAFAALEWVV